MEQAAPLCEEYYMCMCEVIWLQLFYLSPTVCIQVHLINPRCFNSAHIHPQVEFNFFKETLNLCLKVEKKKNQIKLSDLN